MTHMPGEAATTNQSPVTRASSLLVVDDNSMNRIMLSRYISKLGYQAALVENGRQALDKLQGEPFDLVLLDVEMPEMDGYQVLEQLKADTRLRDQEIDYLQQVGRVTAAAAAVRAGTFQPESLDEVARRSDELGQLALVFQEMARQVYAREQHLQRQVLQLRIEIDQERRAREVADITESDYFQQLLGKAEELRNRIKDHEEDGLQENAAKELDPEA